MPSDKNEWDHNCKQYGDPDEHPYQAPPQRVGGGVLRIRTIIAVVDDDRDDHTYEPEDQSQQEGSQGGGFLRRPAVELLRRGHGGDILPAPGAELDVVRKFLSAFRTEHEGKYPQECF